MSFKYPLVMRGCLSLSRASARIFVCECVHASFHVGARECACEASGDDACGHARGVSACVRRCRACAAAVRG
eukprot:4474527-Pleurochrysis_carterae.AAC.1